MLQRVAEMKVGCAEVEVADVRKPSQLADLDGLIIPGGESTTLSVFLRKNNFEEALKAWIFNEEKPGVVWGTCAGLILLSEEVAGQKQGGQITVSSLVSVLTDPVLLVCLCILSTIEIRSEYFCNLIVKAGYHNSS